MKNRILETTIVLHEKQEYVWRIYNNIKTFVNIFWIKYLLYFNNQLTVCKNQIRP